MISTCDIQYPNTLVIRPCKDYYWTMGINQEDKIWFLRFLDVNLIIWNLIYFIWIE